MNIKAKIATIMNIIGNGLLFILKLIVGLAYNSIAIISDSLNSLMDIIASIIVFLSVKTSYKKADKKHPFGHYRAEPIASLVVAIFTGILGFEVIKTSIERLLDGETITKSVFPIAVMLLVLAIKSTMYVYAKKVGNITKSSAILASAIDNRNDILISSTVLLGVLGSYHGYNFLDPLFALFVGIWILYAGYKLAMQNLKFLIGEAPKKELLRKIKDIALRIDGVKGVHDIKAHYVGTVVQVEIHINVSKKLSIQEAHIIGKNVARQLEKIEKIDRAFIHIDPIEI